MKLPPLPGDRNFRLLFTASAFTNLGDGILAIALPWFATSLTTDPLLIGLIASARQLPWLVLSLPAGVVTDRFDRRRLILACDILRVTLALALVVLALQAGATAGAIWLLAGLTLALGSAEVLRDNTAQTILPQIVPAPQLERANGLLWTTEQLGGQFLGPPLAGLLIGLAIALPFGFQAAVLAAAIALVAAMAMPATPRTEPHPDFMAALGEGISWLWAHQTLRRLAFALGAFNFLSNMTWAMMVLYAQQQLGLGAAGYGVMLSVMAAGGLAGSLFGPRLIARVGATASLFVGMSGFALSSLTLALGAPPALATAVLTIEAFCSMFWNIATVSYRQRHIPSVLLGRVNAAYRFFGAGTIPLGAFAGGALVSAAAPWGNDAVRLPFVVAFAGAIAMLALSARYLRLR
jgi:MFS family permease